MSENDLHERLYEAIDTNPLDVIGIVETALAERDAQIQTLSTVMERLPDGHARFGVLGDPRPIEDMPCADWCYACKLHRAQQRAEQAEAAAQQPRDEVLQLSERLRLRQEQAEAERDRFAEELTHQINLHTQRPGHCALDRRACQSCNTFRELRELPSIVAAQARIYSAIAEALRTGNYAACYLADDGTPLAQPGDQEGTGQ